MPLDHQRSANPEQDRHTDRSQKLHHREKLAPQLCGKNLIILIAFITVRELLYLVGLSGKRFDGPHTGDILLDSRCKRA
ncbi:hypothetical protein D3C74_365200 [compost metagenome]